MISGQSYLNNLKKIEQEKIAKLNAAPIKKDIVGEWTLSGSFNTETYLAQRNLGKFHDSIFLCYTQSFLVNQRQVAQLHLIGNEVVGQLSECIGFETRGTQYTRKTTVQHEGTILKTLENWYHPDGKFKEFAIENRCVKEGLLYVTNISKKRGGNGKWDEVSCTRVYKRKAETEESAKTDFNGTWIPIANDRFDEYCTTNNIDERRRQRMRDAHMSFTVLPFLEEVHGFVYVPYHNYATKHASQLGENYNGFLSTFEGSQLVTVGNGGETIRVVQNGKLFFIYREGGATCIVAAPIKKDIVGEWTLSGSFNTETYLAQRNLGKFHDSIFLCYTQSFLVNQRQVAQLHLIGNEVVGQLSECIGFETRGTQYTRKTTVQHEGTILKTLENWYHPDGKFKEFAIENRCVKEGLLYVTNISKKRGNGKWDEVSCTRVYKRKAETEESAKTDFNGTWIPIANDRFEEYCTTNNIDERRRQRMRDAHMSFTVFPFLEEVHGFVYVPYHNYATKHASQLGENYNGFVSTFEGSQLVTVGNGGETIRVVQNGKLFFIYREGGATCIVVYEKF